MSSLCGSFAGVSTEIKQSLLEQKAIREYIVLDVIAQHCNHLGMAMINIKTIAEKARYSVKSIRRALEYLIDRDWLTIHEMEQFGTTLHAFQISPYVLYIRPQFQVKALELFLQDSRAHAHALLESRSGSKFGYQNQNPESFPEKKESLNSPSSPPESGDLDFWGESEDQKEHGAINNQREAQYQHDSAKTKNSPPNSAAPPQDFSPYHNPLPSMDDENTASDLSRNFGTRITQARWIVEQYGHKPVYLAMKFAYDQMRGNRVINNPVGLICWWLERNVINQ